MHHSLKTITELAAEAGVSLRTLRFYEQRGLLSPQRVGQTRLYSHIDAVRLATILKGRKLGFSLAEIETLIRSSRQEIKAPDDLLHLVTRENLQTKIAVYSDQIAQLDDLITKLKAVLNERRFDRVA